VELPIYGTRVDDVDLDDGDERAPRPLEVRLSTTGGGGASGGRLSLNSLVGLQFVGAAGGDGVFDRSMTFMGSLEDVNAALHRIRYMCWDGDGCAAGATDAITVSVRDHGSHGAGGEKTGTGTIEIDVLAHDVREHTLPRSVMTNEM
jgi:hypothetical protein